MSYSVRVTAVTFYHVLGLENSSNRDASEQSEKYLPYRCISYHMKYNFSDFGILETFRI